MITSFLFFYVFIGMKIEEAPPSWLLLENRGIRPLRTYELTEDLDHLQ
jgi:hypothetical protein